MGRRLTDDAARGRAFATLFDRRALDGAYRYATLLLGDPAEAEDATHDAALAAWRHLEELREPGRFDAWFGRILANTCRDRLRARRRALPAIDALSSTAFSASTSDMAEVIGGRDAVAAALQSLSAEHREVIVLRFYVDLTVDQIAARTGVGAGTVKSRLHYALRHLRAALGTRDEEDHHGR